MTEIMPFPENNYETVLLDRPFGVLFTFMTVLSYFSREGEDSLQKSGKSAILVTNYGPTEWEVIL